MSTCPYVCKLNFPSHFDTLIRRKPQLPRAGSLLERAPVKSILCSFYVHRARRFVDFEMANGRSAGVGAGAGGVAGRAAVDSAVLHICNLF